MKPMIKCVNCRRMVPANPRVKNQKYCNRKACRRAGKNKWKQSKIDNADLDIWTVILLNKVQKWVRITKDEHSRLKKQ